jgi:hypothetical protein
MVSRSLEFREGPVMTLARENASESENLMRQLMFATIFGLVTLQLAGGPAWADDQSCTSQATAKKLAGAAQTSFMKKCQTDAAAACDSAAADKKLAGAAKTSFTKKCVSDRVGA